MMKTLPRLLTAAAVSLTAFAFAQTENAAPNKQLAPAHSTAAPANRSVTCGPDTIAYPYLKELVFAAPNDSFFIDAMVGSVRTASQAYHVSDNVSILGVQFWGAAYSTSTNPQTLPVKAYLYSVDNANMPVAILDSCLITVTETYDFYEGLFTLPHTYNQNFAVAVRSSINDTLAVVTNNAGNVWTPNYGESLGWRRFGSGTWNSNLSFFGQDLEYMIFPIVSYNVSAGFNMPNDSTCLNTPVSFTNLSSPLYSDYMFNLRAFDEHWGFATADSTYSWNYGDNATWTNSPTGSNTYTTSGTYTVSLAAEMIGYYSVCDDTFQMPLEVMPDVLSNFSYDNSAEPVIAFTNSSTGAASYQWDFGDMTTSASSDPSHTYGSIGTYTVTLISTGFCGADTSTQVINITTTGVNNANAVAQNAFYDQSLQSLNITLASPATLAIYDVAGNLVRSEQLSNTSNTIGVSELSAGVYFASLRTEQGVKTIRFVK